MRSTQNFIVAVVLVSIALFCESGSLMSQEDPGDASKRLLAEALLAWEEYSSRATGLQGTIVMTESQSAPWKQTVVIHKEIKQSDDGCLYLEQNFLPQGEKSAGFDSDYIARMNRGTVKAKNPGYAFALHRHAPTGTWLQVSVVIDSSDDESIDPSKQIEDWVNMPVGFRGPYVLAGLSIETTDPGFTLRSAKLVEHAGLSLCEIVFSYTTNSTNPRIPSKIDGVLFVDPEHLWVIRECTLAVAGAKGSTMRLTSTYDYTFGEDDFPIVKRIKSQQSVAETSYKSEHIYEFELEQRIPSAEEFTLTAFGLPEPPGFGPRSRIGLFWWVMIAAFGCLILAGGYAWWRKRSVA